jgi:hypothetical protein
MFGVALGGTIQYLRPKPRRFIVMQPGEVWAGRFLYLSPGNPNLEVNHACKVAMLQNSLIVVVCREEKFFICYLICMHYLLSFFLVKEQEEELMKELERRGCRKMVGNIYS